MEESAFGPAYYRKRAAHLRELADRAEPECQRAMYFRLAANWLERAERRGEATPDDGEE